ncbi:hypothetical protein LD13_gp014 [Bacillus phage Bobb]|uniref:Uncharacterized protein n=1 Tax=Bacillus phage Bobb TaxID=1527469 RepID=A0A076GD59_9CAUD|nr:hypothetical protein LD13_gp014 [Bacillus phage Bobb]AII27915.1 hypothetical protein [Bacillus phage Bobb]
MLRTEYNHKLELEHRGHVLTGIIEDRYAPFDKLLSQVYDIVGDYLQPFKEESTNFHVLLDHWVVFNDTGKDKYWGVYYQEGAECWLSDLGKNPAQILNVKGKGKQS